MHNSIFAGLLTGLMTLPWYHQNRCLLVEPIPLGGANLVQPAARQQKQFYQLRKAPLQWRRGERVQCGYQPLELFV